MGHGSLVWGGDPALEGLADLVNSAICRISALHALSPLYLGYVVVWADCCFPVACRVSVQPSCMLTCMHVNHVNHGAICGRLRFDRSPYLATGRLSRKRACEPALDGR